MKRVLVPLMYAVGSVGSYSPKVRQPWATESAVWESAVRDSPASAATAQGTSDLPPVLQNMVDERREFELNLGKAMDTLRRDYPRMLHKTPDFSIYHDEINVVDPSGVQLSGLGNYKHSFRFLQSVVGVFYDMGQSGVQYRMVYDFAQSSIRMSWNAVLVPKIVGNRRNAVYIDGISIYKMDSASGKIVEHRVEKMLMNNIAMKPPYGVGYFLDAVLSPVDQRVPAGVGV